MLASTSGKAFGPRIWMFKLEFDEFATRGFSNLKVLEAGSTKSRSGKRSWLSLCCLNLFEHAWTLCTQLDFLREINRDSPLTKKNKQPWNKTSSPMMFAAPCYASWYYLWFAIHVPLTCYQGTSPQAKPWSLHLPPTGIRPSSPLQLDTEKCPGTLNPVHDHQCHPKQSKIKKKQESKKDNDKAHKTM